MENPTASEDCAICLEPIIGDGDRDRDRNPILKCRHRFHAPCLDQWLLHQAQCPLCRDRITRPSPPRDDSLGFEVDGIDPHVAHDDWFEVVPEPEMVSVKNRHLINVSRPIGINTVTGNFRHTSWDLKGTPPCPKFVVSPWLLSTIEPSSDIKTWV